MRPARYNEVPGTSESAGDFVIFLILEAIAWHGMKG